MIHRLTLWLLIFIAKPSLEGSLPSSGVLLVRLSSVLNPEGKDAAGSCCNPNSSLDEEGHCTLPCHTMLRICATKVGNESVMVVHGTGPDQMTVKPQPAVQDTRRHQADRFDGQPPDVAAAEAIKRRAQQGHHLQRAQADTPANNHDSRWDSSGLVENILSFLPGSQVGNRERTQDDTKHGAQRIVKGNKRKINRQPTNVERFEFVDGRRPLHRPPAIHYGKPLQYQSLAESEAEYRPPTPPPHQRFPNYFQRRKISERPSAPLPPVNHNMKQPDYTNWRETDYNVVWRRDGRSGDWWEDEGGGDRVGRTLFKPTSECSFGSLTTDVIFNNSMKGGDLLIKLPFQENWKGILHLTIEAWHINKPKKMPHPRKPASKSGGSTALSVFGKILETLSSQIKSNLLKDKIKAEQDNTTLTDSNSTDVDDSETTGSPLGTDEDDITITTLGDIQGDDLESTEQETTPSSSDVEPEIEDDLSITEDGDDDDDSEDLWSRGKLVVRLERNHLLYAGNDWRSFSFNSYNTRMDYALKLVCAHNYTGNTCSSAKICYTNKAQSSSQFYCNSEGEVICRDGWEGELCQTPICARGCHPTQGYCTKPGECKCRTGYKGTNCEHCVKLPGCLYGYCNRSYECLCEDGYTGLFCNKPKCRPGCDPDNGYCKAANDCVCRDGWTGRNCTECVPREGCLHGTCSSPRECNCQPSYTGELCDVPACDPSCDPDHGYCTEPGSCKCRVGWEGTTCKSCVKYPGCLNGDCNNPWECICHKGWTGRRCDEVDTSDEFGEEVREGRCTPPGKFRCLNGGLDSCMYLPNGTLSGDPVCLCPPEYSGKFCQHKLTLEPDLSF